MRAPSATRLASLVYGFAEGLAHQDSGETRRIFSSSPQVPKSPYFGQVKQKQAP